MVAALYLPCNYELTTPLLELKDHYVTVNHCLRARLFGAEFKEQPAASERLRRK